MDNTSATSRTATVSEALRAASCEHARFALECYTDPASSSLLTALAAGGAVEAALKSTLAQVLPSLLADRGDPHTQIFLAGRVGLPGKTYLDCRTISPADALKTLCLVRHTLQVIQADVHKVLNVRNAAAHLGIVRPQDLHDCVRSMVVCMDTLMPDLGQGPAEFWGAKLTSYASALRQESQDGVRFAVEEAMTVARTRLEKLMALGPETFEALADALDANGLDVTEEDDEYRAPHECPVCSRDGWITGPIERGELQYETAEDLSMEHSWVDRTVIPIDFQCDVCGLRLADRQLDRAGLPTEIQLQPDEDPFELRDFYESILAEEAYERQREERWLRDEE